MSDLSFERSRKDRNGVILKGLKAYFFKYYG